MLRAIIPPLRDAIAHAGPLTAEELERWRLRDAARGAALLAPVEGAVDGIDASGALLIRTPMGVGRVTSGSLVFRDPAWWATERRS